MDKYKQEKRPNGCATSLRRPTSRAFSTLGQGSSLTVSMMALLVLGACSSVRPEPPTPIVTTVEVPRPLPQPLPKPAPIDLVGVEFIVVETEDGNVLALTPDQYENLALNNAEILRYVTEADQQLDYYRSQLQ